LPYYYEDGTPRPTAKQLLDNTIPISSSGVERRPGSSFVRYGPSPSSHVVVFTPEEIARITADAMKRCGFRAR